MSLTVTDSGGQRGSDSTEITVEDGSVNDEQQQPALEDEEDQVEENEQDNEDSDNVNEDSATARDNQDTSDSDSNNVDEIVDDFLDDLFNRLGLR